MNRLVILLLAWTATTALAGTDVFQKWRTPGGTIYIGDRPPDGSVLLDRIELAASDATVSRDGGDSASVNAEAAAHGREIMRLRAAEREAERNRELERSLREPPVPEVDTVAPLVFVSGGGHQHRRRGHHHRPRLGIGPSPISGVARPDPRLVTPDESARRLAPPFGAPLAGTRRFP
ncbi:MAG: hypothetical protein ACREQJ_15965 [Candidatus Binatia bacterium]